jgi:protein SCO1/2
MNATKKGSGKKGLFLVAFFLGPGLICLAFYFYAIRKPLTENKVSIFNKLEHYGPKTIATGQKDTIYYSAGGFSFKNANGQVTTDKMYADKFYVAHFFCDISSEYALKTGSQLLRVQKGLGYLKNFAILSHTLCPEIDSPAKLREYANMVHADPAKWEFVSGERDAVLERAKKSFAIADSGMSQKKPQLILIDKYNQVRGIYDATYSMDIDRLIIEAKVLDAEYRFKPK